MATEKIEQVIGLLECVDSITQGEHEFYGLDLDKVIKAARAELVVLNEDEEQRMTIEYLSSEVKNATELMKQHKEENKRLREALLKIARLENGIEWPEDFPGIGPGGAVEIAQAALDQEGK